MRLPAGHNAYHVWARGVQGVRAKVYVVSDGR